MASGEITKGLYYNAFLGNSLNTLSITANKIDTNLMGAGSVWWEPLGGLWRGGQIGQMYDDYFAKRRFVFALVLHLRFPGKTVFQISTHPVPRTPGSTILTA